MNATHTESTSDALFLKPVCAAMYRGSVRGLVKKGDHKEPLLFFIFDDVVIIARPPAMTLTENMSQHYDYMGQVQEMYGGIIASDQKLDSSMLAAVLQATKVVLFESIAMEDIACVRTFRQKILWGLWSVHHILIKMRDKREFDFYGGEKEVGLLVNLLGNQLDAPQTGHIKVI